VSILTMESDEFIHTVEVVVSSHWFNLSSFDYPTVPFSKFQSYKPVVMWRLWLFFLGLSRTSLLPDDTCTSVSDHNGAQSVCMMEAFCFVVIYLLPLYRCDRLLSDDFV
jgi:hypothetical protein